MHSQLVNRAVTAGCKRVISGRRARWNVPGQSSRACSVGATEGSITDLSASWCQLAMGFHESPSWFQGLPRAKGDVRGALWRSAPSAVWAYIHIGAPGGSAAEPSLPLALHEQRQLRYAGGLEQGLPASPEGAASSYCRRNSIRRHTLGCEALASALNFCASSAWSLSPTGEWTALATAQLRTVHSWAPGHGGQGSWAVLSPPLCRCLDSCPQATARCQQGTNDV